jgi:hypothetical protein
MKVLWPITNTELHKQQKQEDMREIIAKKEMEMDWACPKKTTQQHHKDSIKMDIRKYNV